MRFVHLELFANKVRLLKQFLNSILSCLYIGLTAVPNCLSGRTSGFIILCLGLLGFQFYSAVLVSFLLNVPVTVISTIQGILDSGFGLGYENVKYARSLLQVICPL